MARAGFYRVTRNALDGITATYDFVWPATAAIWNLRWQVKGYLAETPDATEEQLKARFAHPSGSGSNYRNFRNGFARATWPQHEAQIAAILLSTLISEYEAWGRAVLAAATGSSVFAEDNEKGLQSASTTKGIRHTLKKALKKRSSALTAAFQPVLTKQPRYAMSTIDVLMKCFRYYKEIRNSIAHGGGVVTQRLMDAAVAYGAVSSAADVGMPHSPTCGAHTLGEKIALDLKQVVAFGEVLLRLIVSVDAELAQAANAERELVHAWTTVFETKKNYRIYPADVARRRAKIAEVVHKIGFPKPVDSDDLPDLLKARKLIFF